MEVQREPLGMMIVTMLVIQSVGSVTFSIISRLSICANSSCIFGQSVMGTWRGGWIVGVLIGSVLML